MTALPVERVDLTTLLAGVQLASPVILASGCGGDGRELSRLCDLSELGAFVTPSVTRDGGPGARLPRMVEVPGGVLSAVGLPGHGIDAFLATDLPWLLRHDLRPIVSVAAATLGEYAELARRVGNTPGIAAIEVNLAHGYVSDSVQAARAVAVVRRDTAAGVPVLAKLWPGAAPLVELAAAVVEAGADAVVLPGSLPGLVLDRVTLRPQLGAVVGEVSGPAMRAVGLHATWEVRRALPDICLVGVGGVTSGADVLAYLAAGADAVQLGSVALFDPTAPSRVVDELRQALAAHGYDSPNRARDAAHESPAALPAEREE